MPRIRADNLGAHHQMMWSALITSFNELAAERDPSTITLKDVAERAGMARNTVYNYVKDRDELAAAAAQTATQAMADDIVAAARDEGDPSEVLMRVCEIILHALRSAAVREALRRELSVASTMDPEWQTPFARVFEEVQRLIQRGVAADQFAAVTDLPLAVEFVSGVVGAGATRIARGEAELDHVNAEVSSAVLRMLGARQAGR